MNAHCDCVDQLLEGGDAGECLDLGAGVGLDLVAPGFYVCVSCNGGVGFVLEREHGGDKFADHAPHNDDVAGVGVVAEAGAVEIIDGKAAVLEVLRHIFGLEVEVAVRMLDEIEALVFAVADKLENDLRYKCLACCSVQR